MDNRIQVSNSGEIAEGESKSCKQLITSSLDGSVFYWDLRGNRGIQGSEKKDFSVLDLVWKPFLRIPLSAMDNTFDYGVTKATIRAGIKSGSSIFSVILNFCSNNIEQACKPSYIKVLLCD